MRILKGAVLAVSLSLAGVASAQEFHGHGAGWGWSPGDYHAHHHQLRVLAERQHRLERRIEAGWHAGDLTRREYRRLRWELRDIQRAERFFWSDGYLTPNEQAELHGRMNWLSREVHREKHDVEHRHGSYNDGHPDYHAYRRFN